MTILCEQEPSLTYEPLSVCGGEDTCKPRHTRLEEVSQKLYERYMNSTEDDEIPFAD